MTKKDSPFAAKLATAILFLSFGLTFSISLLAYLQKTELWYELSEVGKIASFILGLSAVILISFSQIQMGKSWRIGVNQSERLDLITHGIYAYIRNPIYLGLMVFALALFMLAPNVSMLLGIILGYLAIEVQVRYVEEPYLIRSHGESFIRYMDSTKRYFPRY